MLHGRTKAVRNMYGALLRPGRRPRQPFHKPALPLPTFSIGKMGVNVHALAGPLLKPASLATALQALKTQLFLPNYRYAHTLFSP